jgi:antitoxin (DNA-binding transcriptional repressor) of toxin-antitoxin stability system
VSQAPEGFEYDVRTGGEVRITHHGRVAATLRGATAAKFLADVGDDDPQELMARLTGNYRHGNERAAKNHPRRRR